MGLRSQRERSDEPRQPGFPGGSKWEWAHELLPVGYAAACGRKWDSQWGMLQRAEGSGIPSWVHCSVRKEVQKLTDWTDPKWALKHSFAKACLPAYPRSH